MTEKKSQEGAGSSSQQSAQSGPGESKDAAKSGKAGNASNSAKKPGQSGPGEPTGGGQAGPPSDGNSPPPQEARHDDPNLEFANKQTDLALEYLRDQLAKEKPDPDLLQQLGWSKDKLRRFYDGWMEMKRAAGQERAGNDSAKRQLNDALKSLGLSPHTMSVKGGMTQRDQLQQIHEQRRIAAPPGWNDILKAYSEGVSGSGEQK
jgi:hypothetical protein